MHSEAILFIQDLAAIMLLAGMVTFFFHKFKQPLVLGYILAGILLGPYIPFFTVIQDQTTIKTLAELGIIFLLFSLGLEFNITKLSKVGGIALVTAAIEIVLMTCVGYSIGHAMHWSFINSLFLGAMLAISSTTIIVKALEELNLKQKHSSQIIFGILIIEDIFAIIILVLLSSIAMSGTLHPVEIIFTLGKLSSFLVIALIVGILLVPKLLSKIDKFNSKETLLITVLGLCFGFCLLVSKLGYSVALGAFVMGAIMAESRQLATIEELITPLRHMFSAIFFVSVGLLFNPALVVHYAWPIFIITLAVIVGKVITCSLSTFIMGADAKTSARVGMSMAQIGEFSFIIANLGLTLGVTGDFLYPIAVVVSVLTTLSTPYMIRYAEPSVKIMKRIFPKNLRILFGDYHHWINQVHSTEKKTIVRQIIRKSMLQIVVNFLIIIGIFLLSEYLTTTHSGLYILALTNQSLQETIFWGGALFVSLPFLIAIYRKVQALSMIFAELTIKKGKDLALTYRVRAIISQVIPLSILILLVLFIFVLSTSILPPIELLALVIITMAFLAAILYRWFVRVHAQLQTRLFETVQQNKNLHETKPQDKP